LLLKLGYRLVEERELAGWVAFVATQG